MSYMEATKPKSKLELYQEKLKERDNSNNFLDRFTENGAGAPLRNNDGSIMTKRRTMLNNDYEDIYLNRGIATPNPIDFTTNRQTNFLNQTNTNTNLNNYNNNNSNINNNYTNNNLYQTLPNRRININNMYNQNDNNINVNINNDNQNNDNVINNNFQMTNFHRRPQSQINFSDTLNSNRNNFNNNENDPFGRDYQGTGILPRDRTSDEERRNRNKSLREEWLKEIEDKNIRNERKKQEEKELELREEERLQRERDEINENERLEKLKKIGDEQKARDINSKLIENKRNNMNQNSYQNNQNQNFNGMNMAMNGNNLQPIQQDNDFNTQNQDPNFRILRAPNTDLNYNNSNNYEQINELAFDSDPRDLENNINEQITKLRNDVNSQYVEMSNLFGKLRMDVIEANQLKNEAEKELQYIRQELAKNKMASLAYDAQLNQVLERHAPYNNMHINIKDVDPLYSLRNVRKDLQSTSNMIYSTDMINEQNVNRVKELSALAQAGQNLVSLKAESEFIPINGPEENNDFNNEGNNLGNNYENNLNANDPKNNIAISKTGYKNLDSESYKIYQQKENENFPGSNEPKILDDYMNKGEYSNMYKHLEDIANINHAISSENKLKTLNKNYEIDKRAFEQKLKEQENKHINEFDKLLKEMN